ncbi:S-locus glycoprotein domain-containing protein [Artemisia annua]|uniref:S-locus glycoprotein domain-containing protein n=1 Tax=Artemisia annua TaxID=35608 RepID=A0A2U1PZE5_ARTAN|nr:S-locus glycoprotein domain-containing protein [Artemisia annua]
MRSLNEMILLEEATIFVLLLVSLHIQKIDTAEVGIISDLNFLTEQDTLVSPSGTCELGFFKTGRSSENTYVGIWYKKIYVKTVIWVANRDQPLTGVSSGLLRIVKPGNLVLMNNDTSVFWASNTTSSANAFVTLSDNGNLVMTDGNPKKLFRFIKVNLKFFWDSRAFGVDHAVAKRKEERTNIKIILTGIFPAILLISLSMWLWYAWRRKHHSQPNGEGGSLNVHESQREAIDLPLFSFSTIANATANFSPDNKLGEGGFGSVYKSLERHKDPKDQQQSWSSGLLHRLTACVLRSTYPDYCFCVTKREHVREFKEKFKRIYKLNTPYFHIYSSRRYC